MKASAASPRLWAKGNSPPAATPTARPVSESVTTSLPDHERTANCQVDGENPQQILLGYGEKGQVTFSITCSGP